MKRIVICLAWAVAVLAAAAPAVAQEQRASIEGTIRDSSGGVLPGVTVEARSPSLAGVESTVSDSSGTYRFPALRPGRYEVTATLQGFQPAKQSDVRLELGQILKIDLAMGVGGARRDREGHRRIAAHRRQAEHRGRQRAGRDHRTHSEGPRLREPRHVGARHHQRSEESRHPDRRRQRRRQPLPDRRRRHDEPAQRHVGQGAAARLRRHRAGEGQRLLGRVPRLARRRHQRDHEVGRQSVSRQRRHLLHRRQPAGRRARDAAAEPVEHEQSPSTSPPRSTTTRARSRSSISAARS